MNFCFDMKTASALSLAAGIAVALAVGTTIALASGEPGKSAQPYAGQEARQIKSLSEDDVRQLLDGAGWGFAKPAELNGYPGPAHVLELAEQLHLSADQRAQVQATFERMREEARRLGKAYVDGEAALSRAFAPDGRASASEIAALVAANAELHGRLRLVHLAAHLETWPVLNAHQRQRYAALRGYGGDGANAHGGHGSHKH